MCEKAAELVRLWSPSLRIGQYQHCYSRSRVIRNHFQFLASFLPLEHFLGRELGNPPISMTQPMCCRPPSDPPCKRENSWFAVALDGKQAMNGLEAAAGAMFVNLIREHADRRTPLDRSSGTGLPTGHNNPYASKVSIISLYRLLSSTSPTIRALQLIVTCLRPLLQHSPKSLLTFFWLPCEIRLSAALGDRQRVRRMATISNSPYPCQLVLKPAETSITRHDVRYLLSLVVALLAVASGYRSFPTTRDSQGRAPDGPVRTVPDHVRARPAVHTPAASRQRRRRRGGSPRAGGVPALASGRTDMVQGSSVSRG